MNVRLFLLCLLLFYSSISEGQHSSNYKEIFSDAWLKAEQLLIKDSCIWNQYIPQKEKQRMLQAIVFPELIRYTRYKDILETKALELLYTEYGKETCDFSIGKFQMKPSFFENIELYTAYNYHYFNNSSILAYSSTSESKQRAERIKRISSTSWSLIYLNIFYDICIFKWNQPDMTSEESVRYLSTAYNAGFQNSLEILKEKSSLAYFPYGPAAPFGNYPYCEISVEFYQSRQ